jgi:hypothetical protein
MTEATADDIQSLDATETTPEGDSGRAWDDSDPNLQRALVRADAVIREHGVAAEAEQLLVGGADAAEVLAATVFSVSMISNAETGDAVADEHLPLLAAGVLEKVVAACDAAGVDGDVDVADVLPALDRLIERSRTEVGDQVPPPALGVWFRLASGPSPELPAAA